MPLTTEQRNRSVTSLLNGTNESLKSIIPLDYQLSKPGLLAKPLNIQFGVLIGFTGDLKGKLILSGELDVFGAIGQAMFGMAIEGEMLASFSGELGNMLAGNLSTNIVQNGIMTDITAPTIMNGDTTLSGYDKAIHLTASFEKSGNLDIYLLID
ncbi:chemotaxis protein CheX [Oceanobacillus massiliensis]|uniref:chemotaxis protein CheX n=1 Tax=Oceanobacillus massiliensis TaxID=1465765 RepID=UPI000288F422|nr:chemotaxis protein CheX [Oceanobacillus massiliensis]